MAEKKRKPGRPKKIDATVAVQIRLHKDLKRQVNRLADDKRSDMSEEIREAIRRHLTANGYWPPPPKEA